MIHVSSQHTAHSRFFSHRHLLTFHRNANSSPLPMSTLALIATSNFIKKTTKQLATLNTRPSSTVTTTLPLSFTNGAGVPPSTLRTAMPLNPLANPSAATSITSPVSSASLALPTPTKSSTLAAALAARCAIFAVFYVPT